MKITIRNALPTDWQVIQKLNNEVFEDNAKYDPYLNLTWPFEKKGVAYYKKVTNHDTYFTLIADVDGNSAGYLVGTKRNYSYRNLKIVEIDTMGVSHKYRSKGIGKQLIKQFIIWAKNNGFTSLYVNAYIANKRAIKFYQSLGMKPIDMSLEMQI